MEDSKDLRDKAREDLWRYYDAQRDMQHMRNVIERQQAKAERVTRQLDPDMVNVQCQSTGPEELLCAIADLQVEYRRRQLEAELICRQIETRISTWTSGIEQRILRDYYLCGICLNAIRNEAYSYRQILRYHELGLEHYGEKLSSHVTFDCDIM